MNITLFQIFSISGLCIAFVEGYWNIFDKPLKPFSCASCLSLWTGMLAGVLCHNEWLFFAPYLLTKVITKYLQK